jgi:hypothetical protein
MADSKTNKMRDNDASEHNIITRGTREVQNALLNTPSESHNILVYSDIRFLRKIYPTYIKSLLDNNEIVLVLTYYDHPSTMRQILLDGDKSENNNNNEGKSKEDISKDIESHVRNGSLIIVDSLLSYFNSEQRDQMINNGDKLNFLSLIRILLNHGIKSNKSGITIFSDMGSFFHRSTDHNYSDNNEIIDRIMEYERSIPTRYKDLELKKFCLYHQQDYESHFKSTHQKAQLLDCHSRTIMVIDSGNNSNNDSK